MRTQRPGVLQSHIPRRHLRLRPVKKKTGSRVMKAVLAIPAHQMDLVRELVVQLDIKLGRGRGFGDRRIEIVARVVDRTSRHGKRVLSVQRLPDRAHHGLGNYIRAIRVWINRKRLPVAESRTCWIRVDIEGVEELHGHDVPVDILRQRLGEVALPLQCSRNSRADQLLPDAPDSLHINQEEGLTLEDGAAQ